MSLAQELQIVKSQSGRGCKLSRWLNQLENKDKEAAVDALSSDLSSAAIHRAFKNYGFEGSESVVWKHRNNTKCAKCQGNA
jgi:hypothetical protein